MSDLETDPPAKAERHLAAILAADVVGYSHQMERDEVGTLRRLRDLRRNLIEPQVAEHRGRVFKTMGDGFLAEFRSALDAVHCAVDIQRLMAARNLDLPEDARLQLRIGINLGDVFHEGDDVFGDGVNIAARLESIAPPGGIYVSRAACDPIRERLAFDFEDLGDHQVKNITRPIQVFGVRIDALAEDHEYRAQEKVEQGARREDEQRQRAEQEQRRREEELAEHLATPEEAVARDQLQKKQLRKEVTKHQLQQGEQRIKETLREREKEQRWLTDHNDILLLSRFGWSPRVGPSTNSRRLAVVFCLIIGICVAFVALAIVTA